MNISRMLEIEEGFKANAYYCSEGYPTIGIGHLVTEKDEEFGESTGTPITAERSRELFDRDIEVAIKDCEQLYGQWHNWPEEVQLILVNMAFNLGGPRLARFKNMKNMLSQGKWKEAAAEGRDSLWYRQVTNRAERLMRRLEKV